jgi:hypothetical protein
MAQLLGYVCAGSRRGRRHVHRERCITLLMINPLYLAWRWPTRWIERPLWRWYIAKDDSQPGWLLTFAAWWLRHRLRFAVRMRAAARYFHQRGARAGAAARAAACRR